MGTITHSSPVVLDQSFLMFHRFNSAKSLFGVLNSRGIRPTAQMKEIILRLPFPILETKPVCTVTVSAESLGLRWDARCYEVVCKARTLGFTRCPWQTGIEFAIQCAGQMEDGSFVRTASCAIPSFPKPCVVAVSHYTGHDRLALASFHRDERCRQNTQWLFQSHQDVISY